MDIYIFSAGTCSQLCTLYWTMNQSWSSKKESYSDPHSLPTQPIVICMNRGQADRVGRFFCTETWGLWQVHAYTWEEVHTVFAINCSRFITWCWSPFQTGRNGEKSADLPPPFLLPVLSDLCITCISRINTHTCCWGKCLLSILDLFRAVYFLAGKKWGKGERESEKNLLNKELLD